MGTHAKLYVGNLPWERSAEALSLELSIRFEALGYPESSIEIAVFDGKKRKRRGNDGRTKLHCGYGYVTIPVESEGIQERLLLSLSGVEFLVFGAAVTVEAAKANVETDKIAPENRKLQIESLKEHRLHKTRQKHRSIDRRVDILAKVLSHISHPGGTLASREFLSCCAPTNVVRSDTESMEDIPDSTDKCPDMLGDSWDAVWRIVPRHLDPAFDFVRNTALGSNAQKEQAVVSRLTRLQGQDYTQDTEMMRSTEMICDGRIRKMPVGRSSAVIADEGPNCGLTTRAVRKRCQVESFARVLFQILPPLSVISQLSRRIKVVDFGCGSGNLCLPLAYLFPHLDFVGVDRNATSICLLRERAATCGLTNITAVVDSIETYGDSFDVSCALHACGAATDFALWQAARHRAAYIVCPCCVGKLKFGLQTSPYLIDASIDEIGSARSGADENPTITHPRSRWLSQELSKSLAETMSGSKPEHSLPIETERDEAAQRGGMHTMEHVFAAIVKAGDISHGRAHSAAAEGDRAHHHEEVARLCKCHIELDRNKHMEEMGYVTAMMQLVGAELTGKSELLAGVPSEQFACDSYRFPWNIEIKLSHNRESDIVI